MSTVLKTKPFYTADDLASLPNEVHAELIAGEYAYMIPPGGMHGSTTISLAARVQIYVQDHDLGVCFATETGFLLASDPDTVLAPDFAFISKLRCPNPIPSTYVQVCPDLILETRSPSDSTAEINAKINRWLGFGAQLVWDLNPKTSTLTVYSTDGKVEKLGKGDVLTASNLLPGFSLEIKHIFP